MSKSCEVIEMRNLAEDARVTPDVILSAMTRRPCDYCSLSAEWQSSHSLLIE